MEVQPAHISQVMQADDGRFVEISDDVCGVAADLKQIDPRLGVQFRFSPAGPYFVIYHQRDERTTDLVLTADAYQGATGAWLGLDKRIVDRIRLISSSSYDFAAEVQAQNDRAEREKRERQDRILAEAGEKAVHEVRRVLGRKPRIVVP